MSEGSLRLQLPPDNVLPFVANDFTANYNPAKFHSPVSDVLALRMLQGGKTTEGGASVSTGVFDRRGFAMTGYTVHTGSSKKFISGWDRVFSGGKSEGKGKSKAAATGKKSGGKKASKGA